MEDYDNQREREKTGHKLTKVSEIIKSAVKRRGHEEINSMYSIEDVYEEALYIFSEMDIDFENLEDE